MFSVYILYAEMHDKYYIGQTDDLERRLIEHNELSENSFTSRYRPWTLALHIQVPNRNIAIKKIIGLALTVLLLATSCGRDEKAISLLFDNYKAALATKDYDYICGALDNKTIDLFKEIASLTKVEKCHL